VNAALGLLLYSLVVMVVGPPLLRRLTRSGHIPRLGVAAWLMAIASVLITWIAAAIAVAVDVAGHWNHGHFVAACLAKLFGIAAGDAGMMPRLALIAIALAAAVAVAVTGIRLGRTLIRIRSRAHGHAQAVRIVGRRTNDRDVVVLDAEEPAAYCVSGRPPAIVVTTATLGALNERQLDAVVAHERAHLSGHHPHLVAALRSLAAAFPRLTLITEGADQVSRLLEMCADDVAARRYGRDPLLSGLLALSGVIPAGALGAADVAVLARVQRLAAPRAQLSLARSRAALAAIVTVMATGPLVAAALAASGALMCGIP
jgi:Zn-dependent protease with chaperone function